MPERLVIIGGDAAGLSAATNARRRRSAEELEIVAFERGDWISFSACGEPYFVAGIVPEITDLLALPQEEFARRGIEVRKRCEVVAIDIEAQTVTVQDALAGREEVVGYDHLVYATGARPREASIEGAHLRGVHEMHTLDDALAVEAALDPSVRRAVIVGGGFIGIEMAEAFHHRGIETTLVSSSDGVLDAAFDPPMSAGIVEHLQAAGVRVEVNHRVDCLQGSRRAGDLGRLLRP
jgi:NADPH-dependent 2,4-dienoyl-CoA reductase/sulfur reductase-like enzyme